MAKEIKARATVRVLGSACWNAASVPLSGFKSTAQTDIDRLTDILTSHRIYGSNPLDFNDPWDCKPDIDLDVLDDPAVQAATAESLIATQKGGPKGDIADLLLRTNLPVLKKAMKAFNEHQVSFVASRWGIYCLCPDACSTLMWSHYSRNHHGICLEFSVANTKFGFAQKVRYQKEYPRLMLFDEAGMLAMLLIKSDVWQPEQEYRLICPRFTDVSDHPLIMDGIHLPIGATDLKSIIVGCQTDASAIETIRRMLKDHAPHVVMRQAVRSPNKFGLVLNNLPA